MRPARSPARARGVAIAAILAVVVLAETAAETASAQASAQAPRDAGTPAATAVTPAPAPPAAPVDLETGFVPDPAVLQGRTQGSQPVAGIVPADQREACRGFVGSSPTRVLRFQTRFGFLRIFATGPGDLVLAVRTGGTWMCSGDRFGPHPAVEGVFEPGPVELWIGTETLGAESDYVVRITETRSVRPGVAAEDGADESVALARDLGLEVEATTGVHEATSVRRGFLPDPQTIEGVAGGPTDAGGLGGTCRGRVTALPTHMMTLTDELDFLQLYLVAEIELTLIVLTPEGRFLCDVGTEDVVEVSSGRWPAGEYRIWVGTLEEDVTARYRLGISEIRRVR